MVLKKNTLGYVIWALYAAFNVLLVVVFSIYSGLFPTSDTIETVLFTGAFTVLSLCMALVVSFLINRVSQYFFYGRGNYDGAYKKIYWMLLLLLFAGAIGIRLYLLFQTGFTIQSGSSVYATAQVTKEQTSIKADSIWRYLYIVGLRAVLALTGNKESAALDYQLFLELLVIAVVFVVVRILVGRIASLVTLALLSFLPVYTENPQVLEAGLGFDLMIAAEGLVLGAYLYGLLHGRYKGKGWIFWYLFVGLVLGGMLYVDAGTILLWTMLVLSFRFAGKWTQALLNCVWIIAGALPGFFGTMVLWCGRQHLGADLKIWTKNYFSSMISIEGLSSISGSESVSVYGLIYLVIALIMFAAICGFFFTGKTTRLTPWMFLTLAVCGLAPMMGTTLVNTLKVMTALGAVVMGGGIAAMLTSQDKADYALLFVEEPLYGENLDKEDKARAKNFADPLAFGHEDRIYFDENLRFDEASEIEDSIANLEESLPDPEDRFNGEDRFYSRDDEPEAFSQTWPQSSEDAEGNAAEELNIENLPDAARAVLELSRTQDTQDSSQTAEENTNTVSDRIENANTVSDRLETARAEKEEIEKLIIENKSDQERMQEIASAAAEKAKAPKPRFVPAGMIVPVGDDDEEEEEVPPRMPGFLEERRRMAAERMAAQGRLKVGRAQNPRQEFDLEYKEGDDFDE